MTWQHMSPEVVVKGSKMCCTSNAVDETGDMLWNGSEDNGNEFGADEGTDGEDGENGPDC